jgi:hypothetical protein
MRAAPGAAAALLLWALLVPAAELMLNAPPRLIHLDPVIS